MHIVHIIDVKIIVGKEEDIKIAGKRKFEELDIEKERKKVMKFYFN